MRIVHVTESLLAPPNGIAVSVASLCDGQIYLGHEPVVLAASRGPVSIALGHPLVPVTYRHQVAGFPITLARGTELRETLVSLNPDIVHLHTPGLLGQSAIRVADRLGFPLVATWHTDVLSYRKAYPELTMCVPICLTWGTNARRFLGATLGLLTGRTSMPLDLARMLSSHLNRFRLTIAPSEKTRSQLLSIGLPADLIRVVPTAPRRAPDHKPFAHQALRDASRVVAIGRTSSEKSLHLLYEAWRIAHAAIPPETVLQIVGLGKDHGRHVRAVQELGIARSVEFLGAVDHSQIAEILGRTTLLVVPSVTETQGLVVAEAGIAGVPAVVVDSAILGQVGGIRGGYLAFPDAASLAKVIIQALANDEERKNRGTVAQAITSAYTPRVFAAKVQEVYDQITG